jgi:hypothetical protein
MTAAELQILFLRALLLLLLYAFVGAAALLAWRELQATRRAPEPEPLATGEARLIVLDGAQSDRPPGASFGLGVVASIGRDLDNEIVLADPTISGRHAVITANDGAWWLEDLGSTNGTFVNSERLPHQAPALLRSGDVLQLGAVRLRLVAPAP